MSDAPAPKNLLSLSWNIATEPQLYWKLAPNPYASDSVRIISQRFPTEKIADVVRAIIFAEPEGKYDRDLRLLTTAEQEKEKIRQEHIFSEIKKYIHAYCEKYKAELIQLPHEHLYNTLLLIAFETVDASQIMQEFPQEKRRDIKIQIAEQIEELKQTPTSKPSVKAVFISSIKRFLMPTSLTVLSILTLLFAYLSIKQDTVAPQQKVDKQIIANAQQEVPKRLVIPKINIDAAVQSVGITPQGIMGVPSNIADVGWFDLGPFPGEKGSAVIAGHLNGKNGDAGVFAHLDKLHKGDTLYVETNTGQTIAFIVKKSRLYSPGYANTVFSPNGKAHLNLITCDGTWNSKKESYSKRLVVFADIAPLAFKASNK